MNWAVVGGAGFVGRALCRRLVDRGDQVTVVDVNPPAAGADPGAGAAPAWLQADVLTDAVELPPGRVVLTLGSSMPRPLRPWTLALDNVVATARLLPQLAGRDVTLLSSIEVYGEAPAPLTEDSPTLLDRLPEEWCRRVVELAEQPCPPHQAIALCQELVDLDPTGRWVYALSKVAQERLVGAAVQRLTVLRLANVVGPGQWRLLSKLVDGFQSGRPVRVTDSTRSFVGLDDVTRVVAEVDAPGVFNVSNGSAALIDVVRLVGEVTGRSTLVDVVPGPRPDSCGVVDAGLLTSVTKPLPDLEEMLRRTIAELAEDATPMFTPGLPVVVPPRPERPDLVSSRMAAALWSGRVRGHRWTAELTDELRSRLRLRADQRVVPTNSGTNALRLAVSAVARPGNVAICPAFTFHATAEVLRQLGFRVRFADVDAETWTLDPAQVARLLDDQVAVVVAVDALGNPSDYAGLRSVCGDVPLVADSAAGLGAMAQGLPVGTRPMPTPTR